jgi:hypothetical protein
VKAGTEWTAVARNPDQPEVTDAGTWSSRPGCTMQPYAHGNGQVIPYAVWTFVASIDDEEVELVQAC